VIGALPALFLPPSGYVVTPVLAWWREPVAGSVVEPAEVAAVHRVPVRELLDRGETAARRDTRAATSAPRSALAACCVWGLREGWSTGGCCGWPGGRRPWDPSGSSIVAARPRPPVNGARASCGSLQRLVRVSGYRQGFLVGALSFAGFLGGGVVGMIVTPTAGRRLAGRCRPGPRRGRRW
jgi:hypothetical protein